MGDDEREAGAMAERMRNYERRLDALEAAVRKVQDETANVRTFEHRLSVVESETGKIRSDQTNAKTADVAERGRQTILLIVAVVWPVLVSGIALIVELSTR